MKNREEKCIFDEQIKQLQTFDLNLLVKFEIFMVHKNRKWTLKNKIRGLM